MPLFDIKTYLAQIDEAAAYIKSKHATAPLAGVICGTGMGSLATSVENATTIPYDDIPHFPVSTVESHHGNLILGTLGGKPVVLMQGRFHFYEGYTMKQVTFPVRVMKALGVKHLIVMNAVGSMNPLIPRGSIVLVDDHINLMGDNPLIGPNDDALGVRFPDMSTPYCKKMRQAARDTALENKFVLHEGVMVAIAGPNMETRAEYRMFQIIGADIVTMSTVPEMLVANQSGIKAIAISTVTDECLPDNLHEVTLDDVIAAAKAAEPRLKTLVTGVLSRL